MPTYEYKCDECGHGLSRFERMSSPSLTLTRCPLCGRLTLRRLIGAGAAVLFRGSGFHETDYRSESYKRDAARDWEQP